MSAFQPFEACFLASSTISQPEGLGLAPSSFYPIKLHADKEHCQIECIKDGEKDDRIRAIRVVCACGQELYLECEYKKL